MGNFGKSKISQKKTPVKNTKKKAKEEDDDSKSSESRPTTHKTCSSVDSDSDDGSGMGSGSTEKSHKSVKQSQQEESSQASAWSVPTSGNVPVSGARIQDNKRHDGKREPEKGTDRRTRQRSVCRQYLCQCLMTCVLATVLAALMTLVLVYGIGVEGICDKIKNNNTETGKGTGDAHKKTKGCPTQFKLLEGKCYKYVDKTKSWIEAVKHCIGIGARLAEPGTVEEIIAIKTMIPLNTDNIWLGGYGFIFGRITFWKWLSKMAPVDVTEFSKGGPKNAYCVVYAKPNDELSSRVCLVALPSICQQDIEQY